MSFKTSWFSRNISEIETNNRENDNQAQTLSDPAQIHSNTISQSPSVSNVTSIFAPPMTTPTESTVPNPEQNHDKSSEGCSSDEEMLDFDDSRVTAYIHQKKICYAVVNRQARNKNDIVKAKLFRLAKVNGSNVTHEG